ncbi:MAG: hypothetical protein KIT22_15085 [Verrucomicrobiae bacterium]|nr:hypothetical protein [Verrucomicrobiae bacterium]
MWGIFKKPADPLKARERELERELARLKQEVERLAREDPNPAEAPRKGADSAAPPGESRMAERAAPPNPSPSPSPRVTQAEPGPAPFPEMEVRRYDVGAAWRRLISHLRGPTANNPRMARMLAAGSIHGLRPLRYERRVARNRSIALCIILLVILWGLCHTYLRNR